MQDLCGETLSTQQIQLVLLLGQVALSGGEGGRGVMAPYLAKIDLQQVGEALCVAQYSSLKRSLGLHWMGVEL